MKLLFYSHTFAPHVGGIETFSTHLVRGLAGGRLSGEQDFSVTVVTQTGGTEQTDPSQSPFDVVREPSAKVLWQSIGHTDKIILAGPAILPLVFALLRRKPVIVTHHGYQAICPNGLLFHLPTQSACFGHFAAGHYLECIKCNAVQEGFGRATKSLLLTFFRRGLCWLAKLNVAVSAHVARRIALPHSRVILHGVPTVPQPERNTAEKQDPVCFTYVGRLVAEKGVPTLIEAARLLKARGSRFRLLIVGDGPQQERLRKLVSDCALDGEVRFAGVQTGVQLRQTLSDSAALVVPSIWEEAAGLSALEQMMEGRPVIASNIGGLAEEVSDAGLRFEAGNPADLADQMDKIINDPECAVRYGRRARERAMKIYSVDRMLQEYRILLQQI